MFSCHFLTEGNENSETFIITNFRDSIKNYIDFQKLLLNRINFTREVIIVLILKKELLQQQQQTATTTKGERGTGKKT